MGYLERDLSALVEYCDTVSEATGVPIPPITSSLEPVLGLLYVDPYMVTANDIELPILIPGQYANSSLSQ